MPIELGLTANGRLWQSGMIFQNDEGFGGAYG
jgi:hypothetical protein